MSDPSHEQKAAALMASATQVVALAAFLIQSITPKRAGLGASVAEFAECYGRQPYWFDLDGRPAAQCDWCGYTVTAGFVEGRIELLSFTPASGPTIPPADVDYILRLAASDSVWQGGSGVWAASGGILATLIAHGGTDRLLITRHWTNRPAAANQVAIHESGPSNVATGSRKRAANSSRATHHPHGR
jgi:hypothetical protein